ncbi:MAG: lysylphosphatidylglycerol synthase transmembrane domain-containing protein [Natrialbaceae archaeon]
MNGDRTPTIAGFAVAIVVLAVLFWLIGAEEILRTLGQARIEFLAVAVGFALVWLCCWGMSLHTVLRTLEHPVSVPTAVLVFSASMFSNAITPFGQAGGEPIAALLISEAADSDYETGLAAIASVDTLHFVPSIGLATIGLGTIVVRSVSLGRNLLFASVAVGLLTALFLGGVLVGWQFRYRIEQWVLRLFTPLIRGLFGVLPRVDTPLRADVRDGIEGFFAAIDRVAGNRRTLLVASLYSMAGWLSLSVALWASVAALGVTVSFVATLLVVPIASIAAITPLPGGLGGVEAAFVALLISTTGVAASTAGAAIIIYRLATYWLPMAIGGTTATVLGARYRAR